MDMSMSGSMTSATMSMGPTSTSMGMTMGTSTDTSMPMSSPAEMMGMDSMAMTFFFSSTTPLFSMNWTPSTTGQYAGTCIFLIAFAAIFRALLAVRVHFHPLLAAVDSRRHGGPAYEPYRDEKTDRRRWRAREAVLTAFIDLVLAAVGYLLCVYWGRPQEMRKAPLTVGRMIAVMTMNVGYFLSVLGGAFLGSLVFNRFLASAVGH